MLIREAIKFCHRIILEEFDRLLNPHSLPAVALGTRSSGFLSPTTYRQLGPRPVMRIAAGIALLCLT